MIIPQKKEGKLFKQINCLPTEKSFNDM